MELLQNRRDHVAPSDAVRDMSTVRVTTAELPPAFGAEAGARRAAADFLRTVHGLTADLQRPKRTIYWLDLCASAALGYAALGVATYATGLPLRAAAGIVAVFALYRAVMFIHELMHLRRGAVPAFRTVWNAVVGVPLLLPSFMYENVHRLHHAKTHYGTRADPEYLPLAGTGPAPIAGLLLVSLLAPVALFVRFAIMVPLAAVFPAGRRLLIERMSSLTINPDFRRAVPERPAKEWIALEAAGMLYVWSVLGLLASGTLALSSFVTAIAVGTGIALVNQARTVVAHRWESDGRATDAIGQLLDTVNVPPPPLLPALWAPLGLRYHGLHHLLPALPYHNLGAAHRRLIAALEPASLYHRTLSRSGPEALRRIIRGPAAQQVPRSEVTP